MLLDSPNLLIFGRDVTRGLYIDGYGAVFSFDASLVEKGKHDWHWGDLPFRIEETEDGKRVIIVDRDVDPDDIDVDELEELEKLSHGSDVEEELYKAGKAEIVETLLDYGDTMTSLSDGEHVAIAAYLRDAKYFTRQEISRLVLTAKIEDLRAYTAGDLSEQQMVERIEVEEY
jgi:hypothetical protein